MAPMKFRRMRRLHNQKMAPHKKWPTAIKLLDDVCATGSFKHDKCQEGLADICGSNTYPVGSFPECRSKLDVYDSHGNVAKT